MAKKKTIDLRSVEPTPVPAGDVNIVYNGTRIAGFSEDTDATLKTGGTRVEHDIYVNYTKPAGGISLPEVIFTKPSGSDLMPESGEFGFLLYTTTAGIIATVSYATDESKIYGVPTYDGNLYKLDIILESREDSYNVTVNGNTIAFDGDSDAYVYSYSSATYPGDFTIVATNKE